MVYMISEEKFSGKWNSSYITDCGYSRTANQSASQPAGQSASQSFCLSLTIYTYIYIYILFTILRNSLGIPKMQHILRTSNCAGRTELTEFDDTLRSGLVDILNVELTDSQWFQAIQLIQKSRRL